MDFLHSMISFVTVYFRPLVKWFLRKTTRLCELQRICYGEVAGAPRTCAVERSLDQSRNSAIRESCDQLDKWIKVQDELFDNAKAHEEACLKEKDLAEDVVNQILREKAIKKDLHVQFLQSFRNCLKQIWGYKRLKCQVERLRASAFDSDNPSHESSLLQLWNFLQPGVSLVNRVTKQWQSIGFQGQDPKTDFRGMGILGLENLLYFAREYNTAARQILSHSHHPAHGYSFAIVGINLTSMAYKLLNDGSAKSHLFNLPVTSPDGDVVPKLKHFHHFFSYLFVEFDKFWLSEKPRDVMEFNRIRDLFENNMRTLLHDTTTCLRIKITVDNI